MNYLLEPLSNCCNISIIHMNTPLLEKNTRQIGWIDFMRIVACFTVVLAHCCDPFVGQGNNNYDAFLSGAFIGSLTRPCVPLFVMISGILLIPTGMGMTDFYKRRLKRVVIPLVIWSLILPFLYYAYFQLGITTNNPNIVAADHTLQATMSKLGSFIFNFQYATIPLWYLYMLVGLYLFMPIIGSWLASASKKDIRCFLGIWIVSMTLPYLQLIAPALGYTGNYGDMGLLGVCTWNPYGMLYYFSGFLGYIVLAYYLKTYPLEWSWKKTLGVAIPLFVAGYAITIAGLLYIQQAFPGDTWKIELFWLFAGINVFMMTLASFIVLQKLSIRQSPLLSKLAALTFGVYLCHFFFVQCGYDIIAKCLPGIPYALQIPCIAIIAFAISLTLTWVLSKSRWTRKSVM